jgi:uncharacterized membrane protein
MGPYHPQIVHFAIALLVVGVLLRLVSLIGRPAFVSPAAALLIFLGTGASVLAVRSGEDAHGPVERVPGARAAVVEHEEWGERARNVFFAVAALELLGLAVRRSPRIRFVQAASAIVGVAGLWVLYQAGEHGGRLVYSYAGGVGIRSGAPEDVGRLLLAGLYHQAQLDRRAGRSAEAAALIDEAARRFPDDPEVRLLAAESHLLDRRDPAAALAALDRIVVPASSAFLRVRAGNLRADALEASGDREGALAVLQKLAEEFPANARLKQRIERLRGQSGASQP